MLAMPADLYEVRPRKDKRGFDLISDALPFGVLWYAEPNAVRSHGQRSVDTAYTLHSEIL
jgi:hypothetical protein